MTEQQKAGLQGVSSKMGPPADAALEEARKQHAAGSLTEAEASYRRLAAREQHREAALQGLVEIYVQSRRPAEAVDALEALTELAPDSLYYYARLAALLEELGQIDAAIGHYQRLLGRQPALASAHFNLALLYKKEKRYAEALAAYDAAIRFGIEGVQEVYSNIGVLYSELRRPAKAVEMYEQALEADPQYVPALFNMAGLLEEAGDRDRAIALYQRILTIDPGYTDSLSRLAYAQRITSSDDPLFDSLRRAIDAPGEDAGAREGLHFSLGKALDDLGRFDEAFAEYRTANEIGRRRHTPYDRVAAEQAVDHLIRAFDVEWLRSVETTSGTSPIFVCGMLRSGSTLVEQILAGQPAVTAGGELDFLPWLLERRLTPFPARWEKASREELVEFGDAYLSLLQERFPGAENVTDKRPDNFFHLGLIRALFPAARIIYTRRNLRDNCLSVYFQQLGGNLSYATDLAHTAHFYRQQERLMAHWNACLGENVFTVDYDALVRSPEPVLRGLFDFLGLDWDDRCLDFRRSEALVKTASVWQVREELHSHSSGRWRNYASHLGGLGAAGD